MRPAVCALCAVAIGGCLIVRTDEDVIEDPCPPTPVYRLADAAGPFAIADAIYFTGANGTLSRLSFEGGPVSELTTDDVRASVLAADATDVYWASDGAIMRKPLAGGAPYSLADGYHETTALLADAASVVWASNTGLHRWDRSTQTVELLDTPSVVLGLARWGDTYYYSDTYGERVRKAPPATDLTAAHYPGPLVADDDGVYFYEAADPFVEYGGALRLVPRDGGSVVTTAANQSLVLALALEPDRDSLFFAATYGNEYRIKQVSRFGGVVRTLACGVFEQQQLYLAIAPPHIYFSDGRGLYRMVEPADTPR